MRFAIKVLSSSDLTFFEPQFRIRNAGNQKSINLNRDVFVDKLYPLVPELIAEGHGELELRLRVNGPGAAYDEIRLVRKVAKGEGYHNYRLNGEFVRNPEDDGARFDRLEPGDLAVLGFDGVAQPTLVQLLVLSGAEAADAALLAALRPTGRRTMVTVDRAALAAAAAGAPPDHPIHDLLLDPDDLEQAALGDALAAAKLLQRPGRRRISAEQLAAARKRAEETGRDGELLVSTWLARGSEPWAWRSAQNAIHPWDFDLGAGPALRRVEVKATRGPHGRTFHISMAEIEAAAGPEPYALWRVSELGAEGARIQMIEDFGPFARTLRDGLNGLPAGVRPDGFSIDPAGLTWSAPVEVAWPEPDDL